MDDLNSANDHGYSEPSPASRTPDSGGEHNGGKLPPPDSTRADGNDEPPPNRSAWERWQSHPLPDRVMAYFTGVVAVCAALQIWILVGGSAQTNQLIRAANINACAAQKIAAASDRNAAAAEKFATNAGLINDRINEAVGKLNIQATELSKSVGQASRLAGDAETANARAIEFDRPWIGISAVVNSFEEGAKNPSVTFLIINSGRRPAKITLSQVEAASFDKFPIPPPYTSDMTSSTILIVPNLHSESVIPVDLRSVSSQYFAKYRTGEMTFFFYADVEYEDVVTHVKHWTHTCGRYVPDTASSKAGFFACHEYNEVDQN